MTTQSPPHASPVLADVARKVAFLARESFSLGTIAETLKIDTKNVRDALGAARIAEIPLPCELPSPHREDTIRNARRRLADIETITPLFPPPDELLTLRNAAEHFSVPRTLLRDGYVKGSLPGVWKGNTLRLWTQDIEEYLRKIGFHYEPGRKPILGKSGLVLAMRKEGFSPGVIGRALEWENGPARVSAILFNLRSQGVTTSDKVRHLGGRNIWPEEIEAARAFARQVESRLPLDYYPERPPPRSHTTPPMPESAIRAIWQDMVDGKKWREIKDNVAISRQGFNLRRKNMKLEPPSRVRAERRGGRARRRVATA